MIFNFIINVLMLQCTGSLIILVGTWPRGLKAPFLWRPCDYNHVI